ncbi:MAG: response regulator [Flavobacterium sp.]
MKTIKILIVDDHDIIRQSYQKTLTLYKPNEYDFDYVEAGNCLEGYQIITDSEMPPFDFFFCDINMPGYPEKGIKDGIDLAYLMRKTRPECKIMILSMYQKLITLNEVIKDIQPNGLVVKQDLDYKEFIFGFDKMLRGDVYYSTTTIKTLKQNEWADLDLDGFDRQILYYLSKDISLVDLQYHIKLSIPAIQRRIVKMMDMLEVPDKEDLKLLSKIGKEKGIY